MNFAGESAREAARQGNGKFGHQAHAEADLDLGAGAAAALDPSHPDSPLNRANDDAFAALQARMLAVTAHREKLTTRHVARTIQEKYPTAAYLSFQRKNGDEGPYVAAKNVYDAEGNVLDTWAYGIMTDSGTSVAEYMDRCDLNVMNPAAGFTYDEGHQAHHEDYVGALDLNEAAELDVTAPAELTEPTLRPLSADAQAELVEIASSGIDEKWDYLNQYGAEDYGEEFPSMKAYWAQNEAMVSPLTPGESRQGAAAQVLLDRHRKNVGDTFDTLVVELGDPDDEPSGRIASGTGFDGAEISQDLAQSLDEDYVLAQQIAHLELDQLDEQTLAASGISINGRTVTLRNTSPLAQHARARRAENP